MKQRPTMADIAKRAGVTKGAVSFALNGRPGVSPATRARILAIAEELGWQPNSAARALSDGRAGAFGLVVNEPPELLGLESFFMRLIAGMQTELAAHDTALLFTLAADLDAEIGAYRAWWGQRRVDGVFVVNLRDEDPRIAALAELGMPAVLIGPPVVASALPAVWSDDAPAVRAAVDHLADLGHRRVARVTGPAELRHTRVRDAAFRTELTARGIQGATVEADYLPESGAEATRRLLASTPRPTAIVYDNDMMAVSGLVAAQRMGLRVPAEVSLVAWDDSALCELVPPGLTALRRDVAAYGAHAAGRLRELTAGGSPVGDLQDPPPRLVLRGSTAPPAKG